jgi:hypothetical protein
LTPEQEAKIAQARTQAVANGVNPDYVEQQTRAGFAKPTPQFGGGDYPKVTPTTPAPAPDQHQPQKSVPLYQNSQAQNQESPNSTPAPYVGRGSSLANPLTRYLKEAEQTKQEAESQRNAAEDARDVAAGERKDAIRDQAEVDKEVGARAAEIQKRNATDSTQMLQELQINQEMYNKAQDKIATERDEISRFIENYEPKDRRSTARRVTGALAVVLGGVGDGLVRASGKGTGNHASAVVDIINKGIDRDLENQEKMLENKRTALAARDTELGQLRNRLGDTVDNLKLARVMKLESAKSELESAIAQGASDKAIALANESIAKIDYEISDLKAQFFDKRFGEAYNDERKFSIAQYQQQQASRPKPLSQKEQLDLEGKALDNAKKRQELNGSEGPKTDGEKQDDGVVAGAADAWSRLYPTVYNTDGTSKDSSKVDVPSRVWGAVPSIMTPESIEQERLDEENLIGTLLRLESGSNIPPDERAGKAIQNGLRSSDETVRARARKQLVDQLQAFDRFGRLKKPNPLVTPHEAQ